MSFCCDSLSFCVCQSVCLSSFHFHVLCNAFCRRFWCTKQLLCAVFGSRHHPHNTHTLCMGSTSSCCERIILSKQRDTKRGREIQPGEEGKSIGKETALRNEEQKSIHKGKELDWASEEEKTNTPDTTESADIGSKSGDHDSFFSSLLSKPKKNILSHFFTPRFS